MCAVPLEGFYEVPAAGEPLELYAGPGVLQDRNVGVRVWMPLVHDVHLAATVEGFDRFDLGNHELQIDHPVYGPSEVTVALRGNDGLSDVIEATLGASGGVARLVTHWINGPNMLAPAALESDSAVWLGRFVAEGDGWVFTLDAPCHLSQRFSAARLNRAQFVFSHVGELRRADGSTFDVDAAEEVMLRIQLAFSFALGRFVAPTLAVGVDLEGRRRWERWSMWRCDWMRGQEAWWDTHRPDDLRHVVEAFVAMDEDEWVIIRYVVMHAVAANHHGTTTEGRVMLAQAALEYLAWVTLVLEGGARRREHKELTADERLRQMLTAAEIPLDVPADLGAVSAAAADLDRDVVDGPAVMTWLRNRLTHPKDPTGPYKIDHLVFQVAQLALSYLELATLRRTGFDGMYTPRFPPGRFAHDRVPVPWATAVPE